MGGTERLTAAEWRELAARIEVADATLVWRLMAEARHETADGATADIAGGPPSRTRAVKPRGAVYRRMLEKLRALSTTE